MTFPVTIFYDGSCRICSAEMDKYRQADHDDKLIFVDISAVDFDPASYGKTQSEFMARLHVQDGEGLFYTGVDAFMTIWQAYPECSVYRVLSATIGLPGVNIFSRGAYTLFARYRHLLPKKRNTCDDGTCNLKH